MKPPCSAWALQLSMAASSSWRCSCWHLWMSAKPFSACAQSGAKWSRDERGRGEGGKKAETEVVGEGGDERWAGRTLTDGSFEMTPVPEQGASSNTLSKPSEQCGAHGAVRVGCGGERRGGRGGATADTCGSARELNIEW